MDDDFLDLLEHAFLDEQIDGSTMDFAYLLMRSMDRRVYCCVEEAIFDNSPQGLPH